MSSLAQLSPDARQYLLVTGNYWAFTLTDGALRMLVVLHFYSLGYSPFEIAMLFLFYEFFGVVTNLIGGWLGAHAGLNRLMHMGLGLQVVALAMLLVPDSLLTVAWVMAAQALSGIAKDLNKMSAKSAVKLLVPDEVQGQLYRWVAFLTGSKNALKGAGFFMGGLLLTFLGFKTSIAVMAFGMLVIWIAAIFTLKRDLGKAKKKPAFTELFSKSARINALSAARLCLFGARDVWFVVALPVYLASVFGWDHWAVGGFLALWIIGYGIIQGFAPSITRQDRGVPDGRAAFHWALLLAGIPLGIGLFLYFSPVVLLGGLLLFGVVFAVNSSLHSYLIVRYADADGVSMDVGFYYMANAMGRLMGTVLSGYIYQAHGLAACLFFSFVLVASAAALSLLLPANEASPESS
ncbi:MAG TPA: MFS transporter [Gammaproteobacteria bacterium]|nr:MFS transporter [Gammaproteobacteria bacterium]